MSRPRLLSLILPIAALAALAAMLLFAATAAAETKVGEVTAPVTAGIPAEADVIGGTASYEPTSGTVTMSLTTAGLPEAGSELLVVTALATVPGACTKSALEPVGEHPPEVLPVFEFRAPYTETTERPTYWTSLEHFEPPKPEDSGLATKSVTGTTTTVSVSTPRAANRAYNCAFVAVSEESGAPVDSALFPIAPLPAPPVTPPTSTPTPTPTPETKTLTPPSAALLSLAKLKPLSAKTGKWTKVMLKLTNSGNLAAGPVTIKSKAPKGVVVKPVTTQLPALLPGQSWTVVLEVQLTAKAKKRSTISLTGTLPGLTATSSVVIKSAG